MNQGVFTLLTKDTQILNDCTNFFRSFYYLHITGSFFVTRAKDNMRFKRMYSGAADKTTGVLYDQIGRLGTYYFRKDYPGKMRRARYYDQTRDRTFIFITNNTDLKAEEIAMLYKKRWEVELFFKLLKFIYIAQSLLTVWLTLLVTN